jgi:hypothetical protein
MNKPPMLHPKTFTYRGIVAKENPLTSQWLVELGEKYGSYFCTGKSGVRKLIDGMFLHEETQRQPLANCPMMTATFSKAIMGTPGRHRLPAKLGLVEDPGRRGADSPIPRTHGRLVPSFRWQALSEPGQG